MGTDLVGHVLLCRSMQLGQPGARWERCPRGRASQSPLRSWQLSFPGVPWEHHLRCAVGLLWGAELRLWPSCKLSTIQDPRKTWLATGSLLTFWWRMLVSWAEIAPCLQALDVTCTPLPPAAGRGLYTAASSPLVFTQSFVLWAGQAAS